MKHSYTRSKNNKSIYANLISSSIAKTVARDPHLLTLAKEVLATSTLTKEREFLQFDMKRDIGTCMVVETDATDTIFYAQNPKGALYRRYVKNKKTTTSQVLSITLGRDEDGDYEMFEIHVGKIIPPEPTGEDDSDESITFWQNHAYVMNGQPIKTSSVTSDNPYKQRKVAS